MSETSSAYDLMGSPRLMSSNTSSPITATVVSTPDSPDSAGVNLSPTMNPQSTSSMNPHTQFDNANLMSMIHNSNRQPFFTFALKYDEETGLVHIDFIVSLFLHPLFNSEFTIQYLHTNNTPIACIVFMYFI